MPVFQLAAAAAAVDVAITVAIDAAIDVNIAVDIAFVAVAEQHTVSPDEWRGYGCATDCSTLFKCCHNTSLHLECPHTTGHGLRMTQQ